MRDRAALLFSLREPPTRGDVRPRRHVDGKVCGAQNVGLDSEKDEPSKVQHLLAVDLVGKMRAGTKEHQRKQATGKGRQAGESNEQHLLCKYN